MDRKNGTNSYVSHLNGVCTSLASVYDSANSGGAGSSSSASSSSSLDHKSQLAGVWQSPIPDLKTLFECPVCFDYVLPPILQCQNGHLVCSECRQKISTCPTCRVPLNNNIRNLQMEKLASTMLFPCKYSSCGCDSNLLCSDKSEHENGCQFKPYPCPCPGSACKWHGRLGEIMEHLKAQHQSITILQGEDIVFLATDINLSGAVDWVMLQYCFQQHFVLILEKQEKYEGHQQFFAVVQLIGTPKQAEQFVYRLELKQPGRRLTWEAKPKSIDEGFQSAFNSSDCLVFDTQIAKLFAPDGNLGINVTISLVDNRSNCVRQED